MSEPVSEPEKPAPTTVTIAAQIDPFLMNIGYPFAGDVQTLAEQMTRYLSDRISERFTASHPGAGLFLAVVVKRADETGSYEYREGHFVKGEDVNVEEEAGDA